MLLTRVLVLLLLGLACDCVHIEENQLQEGVEALLKRLAQGDAHGGYVYVHVVLQQLSADVVLQGRADQIQPLLVEHNLNSVVDLDDPRIVLIQLVHIHPHNLRNAGLYHPAVLHALVHLKIDSLYAQV